jgi:hypothetical protein
MTGPTTRPRTRGTRMRRVLIGIVVIPLLSAIGLEVGCRVIDRLRGKPWDADKNREKIEQLCLALSQHAYVPGEEFEQPGEPRKSEDSILQPYVGWEHPSTQLMIANDMAYFQRKDSEEFYDVYVLGGSVAQLFGQQGVATLVEVLHRDPRLESRQIKIHDYACAGFKEPQQVMGLAYLLALGHEPDALIELDGFNESALGWSNVKFGTNPLYPSVPHWASATKGLRADPEMIDHLHATRESQERARDFGEWFLATGAWKSCFLEHVAAVRLKKLRQAYVQAYRTLLWHIKERPKDAEVSGPRFPEDGEAIVEMIVRAWMETSISLDAMCEARGITYLHVLQPTLTDAGSKPLTQKEIDGAAQDPTWLEGVQRIYPRLREAGPRLAERGVAFYDASRVFLNHTEDLYYDVCHFTERGNEILAVPVAEALLRAMR